MKQPADSCATVQELLLDYAYGELEGASRKDVEAHVAGCAGCRIALMQMTGTRSLMAELKPEPAPEAGLESLLAYAEQAAKNRAAEAKVPRASKLWSWLAPTLGFASAAAVALLFVVKPGGDPTRSLQPALPSTLQAPAPVARATPMPVAEPAAPVPAGPMAVAADETKVEAKAEAKLAFAAKEQDLDRMADKSAEAEDPAKAPAKAMRKAAKPADAVSDDLQATSGANEGRAGAVAQSLAKDAKADTSPAPAPAQQREPEAERAGKGGGGEAVGSRYFARDRAQNASYGVLPQEPAPAADQSRTASAGMSNVAPLDGAKPAPMPEPKPAAPPPPAASGYAEAKKRAEPAPTGAVTVAAAEAPAKMEEAAEDSAAATKSSAPVPTAEQLLRKGTDQSNNGDLAGAESTWATFLKLYPDHLKAPDVALWRVAVLEKLGRTGDAALARAEYVRRWPNIGNGSNAAGSGPRGAAASPARAAPREKAKAADFEADTQAAH